MPVIEHAVHPSVVIDSGYRYGCHNREDFAPGYFVLVREYQPDGRYVMKETFVESSGTRECRHDRSLSDPACEGCRRRGTGEEYDKFVRENGK